VLQHRVPRNNRQREHRARIGADTSQICVEHPRTNKPASWTHPAGGGPLHTRDGTMGTARGLPRGHSGHSGMRSLMSPWARALARGSDHTWRANAAQRSSPRRTQDLQTVPRAQRDGAGGTVDAHVVSRPVSSDEVAMAAERFRGFVPALLSQMPTSPASLGGTGSTSRRAPQCSPMTGYPPGSPPSMNATVRPSLVATDPTPDSTPTSSPVEHTTRASESFGAPTGRARSWRRPQPR